MSQLDADIESARCWMVEIGQVLVRRSMEHTQVSDQILDKVRVLAMCADLPGDMPLRIRCFPHSFSLQA